ncbi:MAG: nucleotide sugar dehydrogenase, partial [Scrofimicrobium sp.]
PMYSDEELTKFGWAPYHLGESVDAVIVQADHADYKTITPTDFPGIKVLFDGRRITNPNLWVGTPRHVIGE